MSYNKSRQHSAMRTDSTEETEQLLYADSWQHVSVRAFPKAAAKTGKRRWSNIRIVEGKKTIKG